MIFSQTNKLDKTTGIGNRNSICILFQENGIGDEICALPALWQKLQEGFSIEIHSRPFLQPVYERMGISFIDGSKNHQQIGTIESLQEKFGAIYSIAGLCTEHEKESKGNITLTRFEQFAQAIETSVPYEFNFTRWLAPDRGESDKIIFAPYSTHKQRCYGEPEKAFTALSEEYEVEPIGLFLQPEYSYRQLVNAVYKSKLVVAIDNGILHLALALGKPIIAIFGGSDEQSIVWQYGKYRNTDNIRVLKSSLKDSECERPCSFQASRGFGVNDKCRKNGAFADCLNEILPEDIFESVHNFFNHNIIP